jgi:hypothetical protein
MGATTSCGSYAELRELRRAAGATPNYDELRRDTSGYLKLYDLKFFLQIYLINFFTKFFSAIFFLNLG